MTCTVQILKMTSLTDEDFWNKQDPFVTVNYGKNEFKTARRDNSGKVAKWANESFKYKIGSLSENVYIKAEDYDPTDPNDLIGKRTITAGKFCPKGTKDYSWNIYRNGKYNGQIKFRTTRK